MSEEEVTFPSQSHIATQLFSLTVRSIQSITFNLPFIEKKRNIIQIRFTFQIELLDLSRKGKRLNKSEDIFLDDMINLI